MSDAPKMHASNLSWTHAVLVHDWDPETGRLDLSITMRTPDGPHQSEMRGVWLVVEGAGLYATPEGADLHRVRVDHRPGRGDLR